MGAAHEQSRCGPLIIGAEAQVDVGVVSKTQTEGVVDVIVASS